MAAEGKIFFQKAVENKAVVKNTFKKIVGITMKKNNSLSKSSRILANTINRISPIFN
jgi:hypothetical protein